jgi:hypothetical protein
VRDRAGASARDVRHDETVSASTTKVNETPALRPSRLF